MARVATSCWPPPLRKSLPVYLQTDPCNTPEKEPAHASERQTRSCLPGNRNPLPLAGGSPQLDAARHIVQVIPLVITLVAGPLRGDWAGYLALPVFLLLLHQLAIWLFLGPRQDRVGSLHADRSRAHHRDR
jgi:hypothetical protein